MTLEDVQSQADGRGIAIDEVGVSGIRYPVTVLDAGGGKQETVASIKLSARLPAGQRGAHLSRFIEVLEAQGGELSPHTIAELLRDLQVRLGSSSVRVEFDFPYFVRRCAPVSGASALMDYACALSASAIGDDLSLRLMVCVPVASVCPCSKAISDYGAHNQRSTVTIDAVKPLTLLISCLAISARDLPSCLTEAARMTRSWAAPAKTAPRTIQRKPGKKPN